MFDTAEFTNPCFETISRLQRQMVAYLGKDITTDALGEAETALDLIVSRPMDQTDYLRLLDYLSGYGPIVGRIARRVKLDWLRNRIHR